MPRRVWKVQLKGKTLYFMSSDKKASSVPLCERVSDRANGIVRSYAHVFSNGKIVRFQKVLGDRAELKFVRLVPEPKPTVEGWERVLDALFSGGWKEGSDVR
mgnify:CR=1 FL=1